MEAPTKGNLIRAKANLKLAITGFDLLDKKQSILVREVMSLIDKAKEIQSQIDTTFSRAYKALQSANIMLGIDSAGNIGQAIVHDDSIRIHFRSVMGVELPSVSHKAKAVDTTDEFAYGIYNTSSALDVAYKSFEQVKHLTVKLAEIENSVYRLAININKTKRRANGLRNVSIPTYTAMVAKITNVLEEREREEFSRLKIVKRINENKQLRYKRVPTE